MLNLPSRPARTQAAAYDAYSVRDFATAVEALNELVEKEGDQPRWLEMRGQVSACVTA